MIILLNIVLGAVSRHFESRRRIHNDSQLSRISIKEENDRKTKLKNRQRQVNNRYNVFLYCVTALCAEVSQLQMFYRNNFIKVF